MKPLRSMVFIAAATASLVIAMPGAATAYDRRAAVSSAAVNKAALSSAAHQYLVDSAPVGTASTAFQSTVLSWMGNPNVKGPEAEAAARPLISALLSFQNKLETQTWPTGARDDIRVLASAFNGLLSDLRGLSHDDIADTSSWEGPFLSEDISTTAATNRVRHDLGLPPLSASV
jgi:hypothetical protein